MIIYSKSTGNHDAAIGRIETPVKMIIEHESELERRKGGAASLLFNVEKSNRFGETIIGESEFDVFRAAEEGAGAEADTVKDDYKKFIEHIQFMKEFVITAEMMEDAQYGIAADAKRRAESFVRAYYKTMNRICEHALINGIYGASVFSKAELDLSTYDGLPLFSAAHKWGSEAAKSGTQANYFWGDIFSTGQSDARTASSAVFEEALSELVMKVRNMKDEAGEPLGYNADTIIIPGNRPIAETIVRKTCGTPLTLGSDHNDINLHYGNFKVVILPSWQASDDRIMIMSSEANKNLAGNMFFNRVPLTVTSWVDNHTGNYIWNGRCRFGVGFGSYKHIILAVDSASAVTNAQAL